MSTYRVNALTASTIAATGIITASNATASTTSSNGALVVTGGVGIGGAVNIAGAATISGNLTVSSNASFANITTVNLPGSSSTNGLQVLQAGLNIGSFVASQIGVSVSTGNSFQQYFTYNGNNDPTNKIVLGFNGVTTPNLTFTNDAYATLNGNLNVTGLLYVGNSSSFFNPVTMSNKLTVNAISQFTNTITCNNINGANFTTTGTLSIGGVTTLNNRQDIVLPGISNTNGLVIAQQNLANGNFVGLVYGNSTGLGNAAQHYYTFNGDNASTNNVKWRLYGASTPQITLTNNGTVTIDGTTNHSSSVAVTGNLTTTGFIDAGGSGNFQFLTTNSGTDTFTYSTGTWTPSYWNYEKVTGLRIEKGYNYTSPFAKWVKIGKAVTITMQCGYDCAGVGSLTVCYFKSLPFPANVKATAVAAGIFGGLANPYFLQVAPSGTVITMPGGVGANFVYEGNELVVYGNQLNYATGQGGLVEGQMAAITFTYIST